MMNQSQEETDIILNRLSYDKSIELLPVSIYVGLMMLIGLFGNIFVLVFYGKKSHTTSTTRLIVAVAATDTVVCALIPKNITALCLSYRGYSSGLCRFNVFINHACAISSGMLLVSIGAFRFRAVCRPFASQFSVRHANFAIAASLVFSTLVSTPIIFTNDTIAVIFTINDNFTVSGYDCNTTPNEPFKTLSFAVTSLHFFIFVAATIVFIVLYSIMGSKIIKYYRSKKRLSHSIRSYSAASRSENDTVVTQCANSGTLARTPSANNTDTMNITLGQVTPGGHDTAHTNGGNSKDHLSSNSAHYAEDKSKVSEVAQSKLGDATGLTRASSSSEESIKLMVVGKNSEKPKRVTNTNTNTNKNANTTYAVAIRQALMLLVITAVFLLGFLPYLILSVIRAMSEKQDPGSDFTIPVKFCQNSYLLISALNPFVYGFFNLDFRKFVKKTICRPFSTCRRNI